MSKFILYSFTIFLFGFFAKSSSDSPEVSCKESIDNKNEKSELKTVENTEEDSQAYKDYLEVLNGPSDKKENGISKKLKLDESNNEEMNNSNDIKDENVSLNKPVSTINGNTQKISEKEEVVKEKPTKVSEELAVINHKVFGDLLKKHVNSKGDVNYTAFKTDISKLDEYLKVLENNPVNANWGKNERLTYWINAYNAFTIKLILDNYPVKSIQDINNGKPWDKAFIKLGSRTLTLNEIENDIIRKQFSEPRIHFAVNCAAASCPPLLNDAFYPETLIKQLESRTKSFISNASYNTISESNLQLSKIFDWYGVDFGDVKDFVGRYTNVNVSKAKITFKEYDWKLNKQ